MVMVFLTAVFVVASAAVALLHGGSALSDAQPRTAPVPGRVPLPHAETAR